MRPVFPYAIIKAENPRANNTALRGEGDRTRPISDQRTHGKRASDIKTTKCSNPRALVSTAGKHKKRKPPSTAESRFSVYLCRKKCIPSAPRTRQTATATFEPAKKPRVPLKASSTALVSMNDQSIARLVPCMNIGDHQGIPPTDFAARKKSPALAKLATNSWLDTGCSSQSWAKKTTAISTSANKRQRTRCMLITQTWLRRLVILYIGNNVPNLTE